MNPMLGLLAVFALVAANGFFVAAEFSLVGARRTRITQLASEGHLGAKVTEHALKHLDSYIAATQLGITLASLALGWIGEPAVGGLLEQGFALLPIHIDHTTLNTLSVAVSFALVTLLHIVLGELAPKSIALQRPEGTSLIVARPVSWFLAVFRPVIWVMNTIGNAVVRLLGFQPAGGHSQVHSARELQMLVQSSGEAGLIQPSEERLLHRAFSFGELQVREIMRPRTEVDAVPVSMPIPDLLKHIADKQYSRYPVYEQSIDTVVGVLNAKDLLDAVIHHPHIMDSQNGFQLNSILRTPLFVPESVLVDDLLERMKRTKTHFAVVIDEYGGMAGVATMEDVIEELVGEVQDEFDVESEPIQTTANEHVIDGLVSITEIADRFGNIPNKTISTTIGGYVAERLDRIPIEGDVVQYGDYDVRVEEMDRMRASRVRFIKRVANPEAQINPNAKHTAPVRTN